MQSMKSIMGFIYPFKKRLSISMESTFLFPDVDFYLDPEVLANEENGNAEYTHQTECGRFWNGGD